MKYDLSVIIPTHNDDKYIERCIESVLNNKCKIQIIVVNDGSTDNTKKILEKYKKLITIINLKNNNGVSFARNKGIKKISGKYFTFIDGDDYIEPNAYDIMLKEAAKHNLDMCGINYYEVYDKKIKSKYSFSNKSLNKDELIKNALSDNIPLVVWNKIYKAEIYKNIQFNEKLNINEDYLYTLECIKYSEKSMFINEYLYNYCRNKNSLTSNYTCKQMHDNDYLKYLDGELFKKYKEYEWYIYKNNVKLIHLYSQCKDKKNRYNYLKKEVDRNKLKKMLQHDISKMLKIEIMIYLFSIKIHLFLFPLYMRIRKTIRR